MNKSIQQDSYEQNLKDHRQIGQEQDYFSFSPYAPGLPFFHGKGIILKDVLINRWKKMHQDYGYEEIESPLLLKDELWKKSGHYDLYQEHMFFSQVEEKSYAIKPMNCPGAILHYQQKKRYSHDLPFRVCEMGKVHRFENSGSLHGLMRVRSFSVDDGHIFCRQDQLKQEVHLILEMINALLPQCGFDQFFYEVSLRSPREKSKYLGDDADWESSQKVLVECLEEKKIKFVPREGEAKFYGPAIDVFIQDHQQRKWQCSTIQLDFNLSERFLLSYAEGGNKHRLLILHRALFGSLERFMGIMLEHHQGRLPFWLSPVQARILLISGDELSLGFAEKLKQRLEMKGVRVELDMRDINVKKKVKDCYANLVPLMIYLGKEEVRRGEVSYRMRGEQSLQVKGVEEFILQLDPSLG